MILNNMKKILKLAHTLGGNFNTQSTSKYVTMTLNEPLMTVTGADATTLKVGGYYTYNCITYPLSYFMTGSLATSESGVTSSVTSVMFGTGNTPVTEEDYCLEAPIKSGLSCTSCTVEHDFVFSEDGNTLTKTVSVVMLIKNTSSDSMTINEAGFYEVIKGSSNYPVMLHREVFASPVTIEAGVTATFNFNFEFACGIM